MRTEQKKLTDFLREKKQFVVPIYQRTYSWTSKQCLKLFEDIKEASENPKVSYHFLGSIVSLENRSDYSDIPKSIIIDGQQRLTTILLLIIVLEKKFKLINNEDRAEELRSEYLINKFAKDDLKYKMLLTEGDRGSLINLIKEHKNQQLKSNRIQKNFDFFLDKVDNENLDKIFAGIRKLQIVDICLDKEHDNPQLIFESLNSTGLELSQADLIRNFVLMGLSSKNQEDLYFKYWHTMEENFGQNNYDKFFDRFMRDYLTIKNRKIPNLKNVYETFKNYFLKQGGVEKTNEIIADIFQYSNFFVKIALEKENEAKPKLKQAFIDLKELKIDVVYPFLLEIYKDYADKFINEEDFLEILNLIESYVFRRFICEIPTNTLSNIFSNLYEQIDKEDYLVSLKVTMIFMTTYKRFPNDVEFKKELKEKDLYNIKNRNFWLRKFENFGRKEFVRVDDCTIEHIMPQNPNLSEEWKKDLGKNWKEVQEHYLHTLGNLTLTGYNSEYSDHSFTRKKTMEGGFKESPLKLNKSVAEFDVWNENSIKKRAEILAKEMVNIWQFPKVPDSIVEQYKEKKSEGKKWTIHNMDGGHYLNDDSLKELFELFRKKVINIDSSVSEEVQKVTIAYRTGTDTSFVCIIPQKSKLKLVLNMDIEEIDDPKNICIDVTNKGHWGTGNIQINLSSKEQLDDIMLLVKQSYENNSEN